MKKCAAPAVLCLCVLLIGALSGCKSAEQLAAEAAAADDQSCQLYGTVPGSQAYVDCRLNQRVIRQSDAEVMGVPRPRF